MHSDNRAGGDDLGGDDESIALDELVAAVAGLRLDVHTDHVEPSPLVALSGAASTAKQVQQDRQRRFERQVDARVDALVSVADGASEPVEVGAHDASSLSRLVGWASVNPTTLPVASSTGST